MINAVQPRSTQGSPEVDVDVGQELLRDEGIHELAQLARAAVVVRRRPHPPRHAQVSVPHPVQQLHNRRTSLSTPRCRSWANLRAYSTQPCSSHRQSYSCAQLRRRSDSMRRRGRLHNMRSTGCNRRPPADAMPRHRQLSGEPENLGEQMSSPHGGINNGCSPGRRRR